VLVGVRALRFCIGYTLTFGSSWRGVIGDLRHAFYIDVSYWECSPHAASIPAALFATFQMMFAVITPLLMTGALAERMKFKSFMLFIVLWQITVYYPLAHWIWGGGFLTGIVYDFAGGIVIHTSAGIGSLVTAVYLGRRKHYFDFMGEFPPSNLPLAATGAALLWIGWFGFNGGSALASGSVAVSAI
jgi:Amt family ammonium transporter